MKIVWFSIVALSIFSAQGTKVGKSVIPVGAAFYTGSLGRGSEGDKLKATQYELATLRERNAMLLQRLREEREKGDTLRRQCNDLRFACKESEGRVYALQRGRDRLSCEYAYLASEVAALKTAREGAAGRVYALQHESVALNNEIARLAAELATLKAERDAEARSRALVPSTGKKCLMSVPAQSAELVPIPD